MEGYRSPDERPPEPHLAKCEKHGLAFDPKVQGGCTICRRELTQEAMARTGMKSRRAIAIMVGSVVVMALVWVLAQAWMKSKRGQVGGRCEATFGCVEGADCMSGGIVPGSTGTCYRRCSGDGECGAGKRCSSGHCLAAAEVFGACSEGTSCPSGTECVRIVGRGGQCLQKCRMESDTNGCPEGSACMNVASSIMPENPMLTEQYCLRLDR